MCASTILCVCEILHSDHLSLHLAVEFVEMLVVFCLLSDQVSLGLLFLVISVPAHAQAEAELEQEHCH